MNPELLFRGITLASMTIGVLLMIRFLVHRLRQQVVYRDTVAASDPAPPSMHPRFDLDACIGSQACITACPEGDVIGWINGAPRLIDPAACVGHGDCLRSCAVGAIRLVLGSERRGVEVPALTTRFETNVSGLFVAGELAGMGLIHNAVRQGIQAITAVHADLCAVPPHPELDVVIVGAGPAGLAAALRAKELGLRYVVLDKGALGGTVRSFPRQKLVMTAPVDLPLHGRVRWKQASKEQLLELWERLRREHALIIREHTTVSDLRRAADGFTVIANGEPLRCARVVLAIGRRGVPRRLGVPGEDGGRCTYELLEPEQYRGARCAVVGGGDSAIESALALAAAGAAKVVLVHRRGNFAQAKPANQRKLTAAAATGRVELVTNAAVSQIEPTAVRLTVGEEARELANDYVIACLGGELPAGWLRSVGVEVRTVFGEEIGVAA
jgi:thioredoxin reductase (NADPH)